ncbi:MAG: SulP family inorganic anion transporter [Planctomycetes bacterium]|nr:SulP family inorganic anion transporter [Planctomycetota bacterium]
MPELGTVEERTSRRDLLQQFGALHEEQVQLRELVAEKVPATPNAPEHDHAAHHPESTVPLPEKSDLVPLALWQKELSNRFVVLAEQLESQGVSQTVRDPGRLKKVTTELLEQSRTALADLELGRADNVRASQAKVEQGLGTVLGELKNHDWAAKVGLLTILVLIGWKTFVPASLKLVPAPLVAVVIATAVAAILKLPVLYVEVPDNLWSEIHLPSLTVLKSIPLGVVFQAGLVLAVVASAETLLCATAVDQMQTETRTNYDRELAAQGIGNMICGMLGALPMTGVIVRSSANVEAGGKTRLSTILHGLWLLIFVSLLAFILRMIPTAALAAMLVYIGYKLINIQAIRDLKKYGWGEVAIYAATVTTIVCADLLTGVITGICLSAAKLLYTFSHLVVDLEVDEENRKAVLRLDGTATFVRLPVLAEELERVPGDVELHVDFEHLSYIDHACLDLLMNWAKQHEGTGGKLVIDWESLHANFAQDNKTRRRTAS